MLPLIGVLARLLGVAVLVADAGAGPHPAAGLAAIAITGLVVLLAVHGVDGHRVDDGASRVAIDALTLRCRASRTAFLRLRDPDAAGRPRPRAPAAVALVA